MQPKTFLPISPYGGDSKILIGFHQDQRHIIAYKRRQTEQYDTLIKIGKFLINNSKPKKLLVEELSLFLKIISEKKEKWFLISNFLIFVEDLNETDEIFETSKILVMPIILLHSLTGSSAPLGQ